MTFRGEMQKFATAEVGHLVVEFHTVGSSGDRIKFNYFIHSVDETQSLRRGNNG